MNGWILYEKFGGLLTNNRQSAGRWRAEVRVGGRAQAEEGLGAAEAGGRDSRRRRRREQYDAANPVHERQPADGRDGRHDGEREGTEGRGRHYLGVRRERVRLDAGHGRRRRRRDVERGAQRREGIYCQCRRPDG